MKSFVAIFLLSISCFAVADEALSEEERFAEAIRDVRSTCISLIEQKPMNEQNLSQGRMVDISCYTSVGNLEALIDAMGGMTMQQQEVYDEVMEEAQAAMFLKNQERIQNTF